MTVSVERSKGRGDLLSLILSNMESNDIDALIHNIDTKDVPKCAAVMLHSTNFYP